MSTGHLLFNQASWRLGWLYNVIDRNQSINLMYICIDSKWEKWEPKQGYFHRSYLSRIDFKILDLWQSMELDTNSCSYSIVQEFESERFSIIIIITIYWTLYKSLVIWGLPAGIDLPHAAPVCASSRYLTCSLMLISCYNTTPPAAFFTYSPYIPY